MACLDCLELGLLLAYHMEKTILAYEGPSVKAKAQNELNDLPPGPLVPAPALDAIHLS